MRQRLKLKTDRVCDSLLGKHRLHLRKLKDKAQLSSRPTLIRERQFQDGQELSFQAVVVARRHQRLGLKKLAV